MDFEKNPNSMGVQRLRDTHTNHVSMAERGHHDLAEGVKFDSACNALQSFHVTSELPLCIAHAMFEEIAPFDLSLVVQYQLFIKENGLQSES